MVPLHSCKCRTVFFDELAVEDNSDSDSPQQNTLANLAPGHIGPQAAETKDGSLLFCVLF